MVAQRISVLVNSAAGGNRGLARTKTLVAELADRGWTVDLLKATRADEVAGTIEQAADRGMQRLILAGGDGLIHYALPPLVDSSIIVGIVPVGTGNDFCRSLGLPTKQRAAIDQATGPDWQSVDVLAVTVNGVTRYAATVLTAGFSGRVNERANQMTRSRGFPKGGARYTLATLAELVALEPVHFRLWFDDEEPVDGDACLIAVGNTRHFGGGMVVCPEAVHDDGAMDVVVIDPVPKVTFARVLPLVFNGRYVRRPEVWQRRSRRLVVSTSEPLWADGEPLDFGDGGEVGGNEPRRATISVLPGALTVAGAR